MKKKVLFVAALFIGATTFAQDGLTSKKGETILPEAGDWAIGFDAVPFLNYAGNMLNGTTNNSLTGATWTDSQTMAIVGKMYIDETTAYRAKARIGFGSSKNREIFEDDITASGAAPIEFSNEFGTSNLNIALGGGIEKRRGSTRIQGFYGAEGLLMFGTSSNSNTYGRGLSDDFNTNGAGYTDFTGTALDGSDTRVTESSNGSTFGFGVRGFIGVEWFVAPKVSIAAEYGWGLSLSSTGDGEQTIEWWGQSDEDTANPPSTAAADAKHSKTTKTGGASSFGFDTDVTDGSLMVIFHF